ncbi:hypothetical protein [Reyranella sp.]|uniref:hypothetical protein n=1 Tax=Reyranella sp. TaxID=1929291 RepID=UPI003BAAC2BA
MLTAAEIARGLQGALGLLQRDPAALMRFENTPEACLRSFRVMALTAPIYALYVLVSYASVDVAADALDIVMIEVMRYVVEWLLFPVIFYEVARRRGWLDRYPRYIGALNWINLPGTIIATAAISFEAVMPASLAVLTDIALRALFFYWFLVTTRLALGTDWLMSAMLLIVNWVPSLLLSFIVARYVGILGMAGA